MRRRSKNAALVLVYTVIVFVLASVVFFGDSIRREAESLLREAPQMIVQRLLAGRHDTIPLGYAETIRGIRGVRSVKPRLWGYYYHPAARSNFTVMASDDFPHSDESAIVGSGVLRAWKTSQDNSLYFKAYNGETIVLRVAAVLSDTTELVSSDLILTSATMFRRLFGLPEGLATDLAVEVRNEKECSTVAEKVVGLHPDTRPILRQEILRTYASLFEWRSGYTLVLLSGSVLAFLIFAWEKGTSLSAEEKSEIGILKALGWDTSDILVMKFWEGVVIALTSFLLGVILAYWHVFFTSAVLFEHALKGWSVLYPRFALTPVVDAYRLSVLFALVVLPYACITMAPAWRAAATDPDVAMR
jgi:ABC-type lipoprotein release transport system permease subunit